MVMRREGSWWSRVGALLKQIRGVPAVQQFVNLELLVPAVATLFRGDAPAGLRWSIVLDLTTDKSARVQDDGIQVQLRVLWGVVPIDLPGLREAPDSLGRSLDPVLQHGSAAIRAKLRARWRRFSMTDSRGARPSPRELW